MPHSHELRSHCEHISLPPQVLFLFSKETSSSSVGSPLIPKVGGEVSELTYVPPTNQIFVRDEILSMD